MTQVSDRVAEVVSEVAAGLVPDIVAEVETADGVLLDRQVPRPRGVITLPLVAPGALSPEPLIDPAPAEPATAGPLLRRTASRPVPTWPGPVLDLLLGLALAAGSVSQGWLELPAALATALVWPPLLAMSGRYRRQVLGQSRGARAAVVLAAGARAAVLTLAISPLLWHADPLALTAFVAGLTVTSALPFVAGVRHPRPRVVLAGRPRDVRDALAQLRACGTQVVVAACLTRSSTTPVVGDVPV